MVRIECVKCFQTTRSLECSIHKNAEQYHNILTIAKII